jgi:peptide/nickel transport system permease protein
LPARGDDGRQSLVLPAVTLALPAGALLAQVLVARLFEAWRDPYVTTARLVQAAVTSNDLPMLLGLVLVATVVFVVVTLVADILHPLLDPRVAP